MSQKQERTKELDLHWSGQWYCYTCKLYTGQPASVHPGHELEFIDNRFVREERRQQASPKTT